MKRLIYQAAEHEIDRRLDALETLKLIDQIDTIKLLLLNNNQRFMLENKGKHLISNKFEDIEDFNDEISKITEVNVKNLGEYLRNTGNLDQFDSKLFKLLSKEVKEKLKGL